MTREELDILMENAWGEDEEHIDSMMLFFNNDIDLIANIINNDRSFNRYNCCFDWSSLGYEIINDEAFEGDNDSIEYINAISKALDEGEEAIKKLLISHNWAIDTNTGVAIGFDDDIEIFNNEVE